MPLWIPITIAAAFLQNLRSALQKHLKSRMSDVAATTARFFYAWPLALLYLWGVREVTGDPVPGITTGFAVYLVLGSLTQILFTFLLIWLFSFRNFAVGNTFSKTEIAQIALLGYILLGDPLSLSGGVAVGVSVVGVLVLSAGHSGLGLSNIAVGLRERSTLIGLASGFFLGASVVLFRGAAHALDGGDSVMRAATTVAWSTAFQTAILCIYLRWREPGQLSRLWRHWRQAGLVSVVSILGSICWVTAFTIENAAYVRTLGQVELLFSLFVSVAIFRERITRLEIVGILLVAGAIGLLMLGN
ncbi:MAG: EamA family transporter [Alphaproteobacteria bacterium]|jgi:drug/metabolite transporter (DMT)-like permease|nr:EamA family transporter [Alphaproteobacteria bacterium]MDP6565707.1 EamA family transporter [Alphaproteobacteria bacterium]MDP6814983.1 EamA family transporter [Alphaproteobacteria bacterium]